MDASRFTSHARPAVEFLRTRLAQMPLQVSDVQDDQGHQYVDVVLEGGGVLGVALVGYLYALEQAGIRFLSVGGTSAGSIVALLLAACGKPHEARAAKLIELVANMPVASFQDGDADANDFIAWLLEDSSKLFQSGVSLREVGAWVSGVSRILQVRDNLHDDLGLCAGDAFAQWVRTQLAAFAAQSTRQVQDIMQPPEAGLRYVGSEADGAERTARSRARLCLVAADVTTERKVQFPADARLYHDGDPGHIDPAEFVRASMSVPFFFRPTRCAIAKNAEAVAAWNQRMPEGRQRAERHRQAWPPVECLLVDGGIMSNFPIDAFHVRGKVPTRPTFGVKLEVERAAARIDSPFGLLMQLFNSARHCRDNDLIETNPDYNALITSIDTGEHHWLDFNLGEEAKLDLFLRGAQAGAAFVIGEAGRPGFNWANYKEVRRALVAAEDARTFGRAAA